MNLHEKGIIPVLPRDFLIFANSKKTEILRNPRLYPNLFQKIKFACLREVEVRRLNRWVKSLTPLFPYSHRNSPSPLLWLLISLPCSSKNYSCKLTLTGYVYSDCSSPLALVNLPHNCFINDTPSVQHKTQNAQHCSCTIPLHRCVCLCVYIHIHTLKNPVLLHTYLFIYIPKKNPFPPHHKSFLELP